MVIERVIDETPDVRTFRLVWPTGVDVKFRTGQFITVWFPNDPATKRAYSLSSCELDRGFFDITIKKAGNFGTRIYETAKEGMTLGVIPPVGKFTMPDDVGKDIICIAGGSGVTPFRGFARHLTRQKRPTKITVMFSVRRPFDIIFHDEFRQLETENINCKFLVTVTRLQPEDKWSGHTGRITPEWIQQQVRDLPNTVFYACGPNTLVEAAEQLTAAMGVSKEQMKTEKWG